MKKIFIYDALANESLYRRWLAPFEQLAKMYNGQYSSAEVWNEVKQLVPGIAEHVQPVVLLRARAMELTRACYQLPYDRAEHPEGCPHDYLAALAKGCLYTMVVQSAPREVAQRLIDELPLYADSSLGAEVTQVLRGVVDDFRHDRLERDYDYTRCDAGYTQPDVDAQAAAATREAHCQEELAEATPDPEMELKDVKLSHKLRIELLRLLLKAAGADIQAHGNRKVAGQLVAYITGISQDICRKWIDNPQINYDTHKKAIDWLNHLMDKLKMKLRILP